MKSHIFLCGYTVNKPLLLLLLLLLRGHIAGSSLELIEVTCCFEVDR